MAGSRSQRLVIRMLEGMCRLLWGFPPRMIPVVVRTMGARRALVWFATNMPRYLMTLHVLGPLRTHLACVAISLYNGCTYCAYGHAYAIELLYVRDRDRAFPLDAYTISRWLNLDPHVLGERLRGVMQQAGLHAEALWVDRTLALASGAEPTDRTETRLAHLVHMVSVMNEIAIAHRVPQDQAWNPINKDLRVKARYMALRLSGP